MTYDWDAHLDWYSGRPDPDLYINSSYFYSRYGFDWDFGPGRITYDEIRAQHQAAHPPRCTCSLGRCTVHPAEPMPEPPAKPCVAEIAVRALLTAGP